MYKLKLMIFIVITDDDENSFVTEAIFSFYYINKVLHIGFMDDRCLAMTNVSGHKLFSR